MECTPNVLKFKQQFGTELKRSVHLPTYFKDMEMIGKPFLCTPPKQITFVSFFKTTCCKPYGSTFELRPVPTQHTAI